MALPVPSSNSAGSGSSNPRGNCRLTRSLCSTIAANWFSAEAVVEAVVASHHPLLGVRHELADASSQGEEKLLDLRSVVVEQFLQVIFHDRSFRQRVWPHDQ